MPTSYEEWKNYDPNDPKYLSSYERLMQDSNEVMGHAQKWFKNVGEDVAYGVPMWATGKGLSYVPFKPVSSAGRLMQLLGGMQMQWAPISATKQTANDILKPVEPPQTDEQHLKKWFKNTGIGAGIGLGTAALGKGIMMIPHPVATAIGGGLVGTGLLATKLAPVESTLELGIDKFFRNGKPRPTPPPELTQKKDYTANIYGAALPGTAGLAGGYALGGLIPAIRKRKALRLALALAAAGGAGYWGWKETNKANQLNNIA